VKKFWRYIYSFWQNVRTCQTNVQTDRQTPHDDIGRACIASRCRKPDLDPSDKKSYWPISSLSVLSKVLERLVNSSDISVSASCMLPEMQSAYRSYHSTETAVAYFELSVTSSKHWIVAILQLLRWSTYICRVSQCRPHGGTLCLHMVFAPLFLIGLLHMYTAILNFKNFNFWSCVCNRVQYLMECTKFHQNRTIFHWYMAI